MHEQLAALLADETRRVHQCAGADVGGGLAAAKDVQLIRESLSLLCLINAYGGSPLSPARHFFGRWIAACGVGGSSVYSVRNTTAESAC